MSYNITTWKTKKIRRLEIPLFRFYNHERTDLHPSLPIVTNFHSDLPEITLKYGDGGGISGTMEDGYIHVYAIDICGDGSGDFMYNVLIPTLEVSLGELEAIIVWENGDSITKLNFLDHSIKHQQIEL